MATLKTPNLDDVFRRWVDETPAAKLEKQFKIKKVTFQKSQISIAETVFGNEKYVICFFQSKQKPTSEVKGKSYKVDAKKIQQIVFYDFLASSKVDRNKWRGNEIVPMIKTLEEVNCTKCGGKGLVVCKTCNGERLIKCKNCAGSGSIKCSGCEGKGKIDVKIRVLKGEDQSKDSKIIKINCPKCYGGSGKITCPKCGGSGKTPCGDCKSQGSWRCDECGGYGVFYKYDELPVPFKDIAGKLVPHLVFKKEYEKYLGERVSEIGIEDIEGIKIIDVKKLSRKEVEPQLGYYDKNVDKLLSQTKKLFNEVQKDPFKDPKYPIYLFPLLELDCKTPKGKKFQIFSIGTEKNYIIIDHF
ncbi:MAG: hypothetical protein ACTSPY_12115 [Candidatus Helarchaeota archaeon]